MTFNSEIKTASMVRRAIVSTIKDGRAFLVAEAQEENAADDGGRILGFATYGQFRAGAGYLKTMEYSAMVCTEVCAKGIGRSLMKELLQQAKLAGVQSIFAGVGSDNPKAVMSHRALGFEVQSILPRVG